MNEATIMLTRAEVNALFAVRDGKVTRVYRANGNVMRGPKGIGAATLWRLDAKRLIADGRSNGGCYETRCPMELTSAGTAALDWAAAHQPAACRRSNL
jgi:hypothetical protein